MAQPLYKVQTETAAVGLRDVDSARCSVCARFSVSVMATLLEVCVSVAYDGQVATDAQKRQMQQIVKSGQFEFVGGGWRSDPRVLLSTFLRALLKK